MKTHLAVTVLLLGTLGAYTGKDACGGTEDVGKMIQAASAALLERSASDARIRGALIQLLDAAILTLPKSEQAAEARSNLAAARAELKDNSYFSEKAHRHLALAYRALSSGKDFKFPDIHTIEDANIHIKNLLASSLDSLKKGQGGLASRSLVESVIMVVTPMSR